MNIDELTKELLYDLYFVKNMTQYEIAELFGVRQNVISVRFKKLVIAIPFKPIEDETLIDMKLKGFKDKDIAEELGRSEESVRFRRQTLINQDKLDWQYRKSVSC